MARENETIDIKALYKKKRRKLPRLKIAGRKFFSS